MQFCGDLPLYYVILSIAKDLLAVIPPLVIARLMLYSVIARLGTSRGNLPLYYVILSAAKDLEVCMRVDGRAV